MRGSDLARFVVGDLAQAATLQSDTAYWDITADTTSPLSDDDAMELALAEARAAAGDGEVPVGAVTLVDGRVVAARHNEREATGDPTAHAEMLALRDTAAALGGWRLSAVTLVVTLEPCPMCAGALVAARVGRLVFGATDPRAGACGTLYNLCADPRLNHEIERDCGRPRRRVRCAAHVLLLRPTAARAEPARGGLIARLERPVGTESGARNRPLPDPRAVVPSGRLEWLRAATGVRS